MTEVRFLVPVAPTATVKLTGIAPEHGELRVSYIARGGALSRRQDSGRPSITILFNVPSETVKLQSPHVTRSRYRHPI